MTPADEGSAAAKADNAYNAAEAARRRAMNIPERKVDGYRHLIARQLDEIAAQVAGYGEGESVDYGHVGSLCHVADELADVLGFLRGCGAADLPSHLRGPVA